jgi:hypothetical protein
MARCHHCGFDLRLSFASEADVGIVKLNQEQMQLLKCANGTIGNMYYGLASDYFRWLHDEAIKFYKCEIKNIPKSEQVVALSKSYKIKKGEVEHCNVNKRVVFCAALNKDAKMILII